MVEDLRVKVKMITCSGKACTNNSDTGIGDSVLEYDTKIWHITKTEKLVRQRLSLTKIFTYHKSDMGLYVVYINNDWKF